MLGIRLVTSPLLHDEENLNSSNLPSKGGTISPSSSRGESIYSDSVDLIRPSSLHPNSIRVWTFRITCPAVTKGKNHPAATPMVRPAPGPPPSGTGEESLMKVEYWMKKYIVYPKLLCFKPQTALTWKLSSILSSSTELVNNSDQDFSLQNKNKTLLPPQLTRMLMINSKPPPWIQEQTDRAPTAGQGNTPGVPSARQALGSDLLCDVWFPWLLETYWVKWDTMPVGFKRYFSATARCLTAHFVQLQKGKKKMLLPLIPR